MGRKQQHLKQHQLEIIVEQDSDAGGTVADEEVGLELFKGGMKEGKLGIM